MVLPLTDNLLPPPPPPFIFLTKLPLFQLLLLLLSFSNCQHQPLSQLSPFSPSSSSSAMGQLIAKQQHQKLVEKAEQPIMANSTGPIVPTSHGQIRGKTLAFEWGQMDAFFAIPYAKPPVAELRFEKTRPLEPWEGIRDALELPPMAIPWVRPANWAESADVRAQYSEDCLYLNLFRPHPPDAEVNDDDGNGDKDKKEPQLLPVLAIIPGGGFQKGSARRYGNLEEIGRKYLRRGILVAVIQSRIGIFGFASSGTAEFAGNLGYWDQREALRWLQANLAAFGGDPGRITLFGYSSGSTSVSSLAVSPHSQDLFAQSIQMSGSVMMCRAASEKVVEETRKLAQAIGGNKVPMPNGTNVTNGKEDPMKEWLKTKTLDDFFDGIDKIGSTRAGLNYVKFGPRLDGDFLPSDFGELIAKAKPKPTIIGLTEMEPLANVLFGKNSSLHWDAIPWAQFATFGPHEFEEYIRQRVITAEEFPVPARREAFIGDLMDFYLANLTVYDGPRAYLEQLVQVMADLQFIVPFTWEVEARAKAATAAAINGTQNANATTTTNLFAYMNKYANARWFPPEVWLHRPFHDSDHPYVFRNPAPDDYKFDAEDEQIEGHLNEFMANFVKTGNPSTAEIRWDPAPAKSTEGPLNGHMLIQMPQPEMSHGFEAQKRVDFWNRMTAKYSEYNLVLGRKGGDAHGNGKEDGEDQQQNGNGTSGTTLMGLSKNAIGMALLFLLLLMGQFTALLM